MRGYWLAVFLIATNAPVFAEGQEPPPAWAYAVNPPGFARTPDNGQMQRMPGSDVSYSIPQTRDRFLAPDWHAGEHPPMPQVVSSGRRPDVFACGFCHRADGPGGPENASLAGLPADYIIQQMHDFKSGRRTTAVPQRLPPNLMISLSKAATDEEFRIAAEYFASIKPRQNIRVIETNMVPKARVTGWFYSDPGTGDKEPIGNRIIEVPQDLQQFENRDTHSTFIAYVPTDSPAKGRQLADAGDDKTRQCVSCHGPDLKGLANVPGIAGRSPSYIVRQLYDIKHGFRNGDGAALMKPVVEKLSTDDMMMLAAYVASLAP